MPKFLVTYLITAPVFLFIDLIWLNLTSQAVYKKYIGHLMTDKPNLLAALIFYLLFTVGLIIFSIDPALHKDSFKTALILGALFGFFTYATYDLTNFATLKNWPFAVVVIDILWGSFVCALVSVISFFIMKRLS